MKKLILILLTVVTFTSFSGGAFASSVSRDEKTFKLARGCLGYLTNTRNNNGSYEEITKKRKDAETILIRGINSKNPAIRRAVIDAYNEEIAGFKASYDTHIKANDGKECLSLECLNELSRVGKIIGIKW